MHDSVMDHRERVVVNVFDGAANQMAVVVIDVHEFQFGGDGVYYTYEVEPVVAMDEVTQTRIRRMVESAVVHVPKFTEWAFQRLVYRPDGNYDFMPRK